MSQVIDGEWVAVGIRKPEALGRDHTRMYAGKPSYRFTLGRDDSTLEGYAPGETKGVRTLLVLRHGGRLRGAPGQDLHRCPADEDRLPPRQGHLSAGHVVELHLRSDSSELSPQVSTIFAQWHGMPDRTLVTAPDGRVVKLPAEEFLAMQGYRRHQEGHGLRTGGNHRQERQQGLESGQSRRAGRSNRAAIPAGVRILGRVFLHQGQLRPPLVHRQDRPLQRQCGQSPGDGARHLGVQSLDDSRADAFRRVPEGALGDLHRGDRLDAVRRRGRDDRASGTPRRTDDLRRPDRSSGQRRTDTHRPQRRGRLLLQVRHLPRGRQHGP